MARVIAGTAGGRRLAVPAGRDTRPTSDRAREGLFATISSIVGPLTGKRVMDLYAGSGAVGLEALSRGAGHVLLVESGGPALRVIRANVAALGLPGAEVAPDRVERLLAAGPSASQDRERDQDRDRDKDRDQDRDQVQDRDQEKDRDRDKDCAQVQGRDQEKDQGRDQRQGRYGVAYDVVFADPPYAMPDLAVAGILEMLDGRGWLAPGALVIVERATRSGRLHWPDGYRPDRARKYGEATIWYGLAPRALGLDD